MMIELKGWQRNSALSWQQNFQSSVEEESIFKIEKSSHSCTCFSAQQLA
jgi:hypothetical protein